MKVVIWCGGRGIRLNEMTEFVPKPIIPIGGRPILWHLMKIYSHFGFNEFVLCLGYKSDAIKQYFLNYPVLASDFTKMLRLNSVDIHSTNLEDWKITFAETGLETLAGGRLLKVKKFLENEDNFMTTYGDGLANIDINELLEFHKKMGKIGTVTGGHPYSKWGMIKVDSTGLVESFWQKPSLTDYINIGFMVFNKEVFDYIKGDVEVEKVLQELVRDNQLAMFKHEGFFHAMDTYRDYLDFNKMWEINQPPWKIWQNDYQ